MTRLPTGHPPIIPAELRFNAGTVNFFETLWNPRASPSTKPSGGISITAIGGSIRSVIWCSIELSKITIYTKIRNFLINDRAKKGASEFQGETYSLGRNSFLIGKR